MADDLDSTISTESNILNNDSAKKNNNNNDIIPEHNNSRPVVSFSMAHALSMVRHRQEEQQKLKEEKEKNLEEEIKEKARAKRKRRRQNQKLAKAKAKEKEKNDQQNVSQTPSAKNLSTTQDSEVSIDDPEVGKSLEINKQTTCNVKLKRSFNSDGDYAETKLPVKKRKKHIFVNEEEEAITTLDNQKSQIEEKRKEIEHANNQISENKIEKKSITLIPRAVMIKKKLN